MSDEAKPLKWSRALPYCKRCGSVQPKHACDLRCCVCGRDSFEINLSLHQDRFYCWDHISHQAEPRDEEPITGEVIAGDHNQLELLDS